VTEQINTNFDPDPFDDELELGGIRPVPIINVGESVKPRAPEFGSCSIFTAPVANTAIPVQILQRRPLRYAAYIYNYDPVNDVVIAENPSKLQLTVPAGYPIPAGKEIKVESQEPYWVVASAEGITGSNNTAAAQGATAANPGTGTAVATIPAASLPAGTYSVTVQTYMDGTTPGAADDDNMGLHLGAASVTHLNAPGVADNIVNSGPYILTTNGAQTISVVVLNTVATGAVYHAAITATPYPFSPPQEATSVLVGVRDESWLDQPKRKGNGRS
jgi:hypothetical protein